MLTIETVDSYDTFLSLAPFWDELLAQCDSDMIYMTHAWFTMYWPLFEQNSEMKILVFRQDGVPTAIAPLMRIPAFWRGIPHSCLTFIANFFSCRTGLINPTKENIFALALRHFKDTGVDFDMAYVNFVPEGSGTAREIVDAVSEHRLANRMVAGEFSPYIPLTATPSWDDFLKSKNKHFRDNLKRTIKLFETSGDYELKTYDRPEQLPEAWGKLLEVSRHTWKFKKGTAIASIPSVEQFFRRFAEMAVNNGWFKILLLEHKGKPVAFTYELPYKKHLFFNKTGFDEDFSRLSPGTYILCRSIKDAIEGGFEEFDLLGKNEEYKMRFTSQVRAHHKFFIFSDTAVGRLLARYELAMLPWARGVLGKMKGRARQETIPVSDEQSSSPIKTGRDTYVAEDFSSSRLTPYLKPFRNFFRGISGHINR